jgi:hypothetical protein
MEPSHESSPRRGLGLRTQAINSELEGRALCGRTFAKRGGVAVDLDQGETQSVTLRLQIESVDPDLSQVGGVDPWSLAAVIS